MKERYIPTKDLVTGVKVTYKLFEGVYKPLEPHLKRATLKGIRDIVEVFDKNT